MNRDTVVSEIRCRNKQNVIPASEPIQLFIPIVMNATIAAHLNVQGQFASVLYI